MKNMKGGPGGKKKRIQNGPQNLHNGMESTGNGGCVDVYRLIMCVCAGCPVAQSYLTLWSH